MLFRALGDIAVVADDSTVTKIVAGRQRALLALLLADAPKAVSRSALIEGLWGDALPASPESALQVAMSRLRSQLGMHGERILAERGGYRLDVTRDEVDLLTAEALLRDGRNALAAADFAVAAEAFERALALWVGEALDDLVNYPFCETAARRIADVRITLVEARNDAYLSVGRHLEVLLDADTWIDKHPFREHLRAQHAVALYRAGRQADALRACDDLRATLVDVGLQPSPGMQELERRLLDQDATLSAARAGLLTPLPEWTAQTLPFVGREDESARVMHALNAAANGAMRLVLVTGEAGIGKSRFLLHVARGMARDAIVIPLHVNHLWESTLAALARAIAGAVIAMPDEDLEFIVRDLPEIPNDVPLLKSLSRSIVSGTRVDLLDDVVMMNGGARWIAAMSAKAPVVLVIDDFDTAGAPLYHIVAKIATLRAPKRVLVVASARGPVETTAPQLAQLVVAAGEHGIADSLDLRPLTEDDVDAVLARMRVAPRRELVERLMEISAGHPLLLAEILGGGPAERVVENWSTRPRVSELVHHRIAELGEATADVLRAAALFESDFTTEILAAVLGVSEKTVAQLLDRALDAHVLHPTTSSTYRFTHKAYRQTLIGDLGSDRRAEGHRRIATVLEERGDAPAALLAAHWAGAAGADAQAKVATYARAAARDALALSEPHSALYWLEIAAPNVDDSEQGMLLVELAEAQQLAGNAQGIESLSQAVKIALENEDDGLILRIVRAQLPAWSTLPGVAGTDSRRLLVRALEVVDDDVTRSRATAWLATDIALENPADGLEMMGRALALARATGDRDAIADCLVRLAAVAATPHDLSARQAATAELLEVVRPLDVSTRYLAWSTVAVSAIQEGNLEAADAAIAEADDISSQYDLGPVRWSRLVRLAWRSALGGDVDESGRHIAAAVEFGTATGIPAASDVALLQRAFLLWQCGRAGDCAAEIRRQHARVAPVFPAVDIVLARAIAEDADGCDEARDLLARFAADGFRGLRRGPFWSSALVLAAETAALVRMPDAAAAIRDLLLPFHAQVAHPGMWVAGPIAYGIGVACRGCDDPEAGSYLDEAIMIATRLRAPLLVEHARAAVDRVGL